MEKKVLNYRVIIDKEGSSYNAYCPKLGLADYGKTIDQAIERLTNLIKFHIESLAAIGEKIPLENGTTTVITSIAVPSLPSMKFSLS